MNKEDLVTKVSQTSGLTKVDSAKAVNATFDAITQALQADEKLTLVGFGTFQVKERAAREGRNPRTGEPVHTPAKKAPVFEAGKSLKQAVN